MNNDGFVRRSAIPVIHVFILAAVSFMVYFGSRRLDAGIIKQTAAGIFGTLYFLSIFLGPLYVFTRARIRGAPLPECVLASMVVPFIWMTKEVYLLTYSHPVAESVYWFLNPLNLWLSSFAVFEMGLGAIIAGFVLRRRGIREKFITPGPPITMVLSLAFAISIFAWGQGENVYVLFLEGYRSLFGAGI